MAKKLYLQENVGFFLIFFYICEVVNLLNVVNMGCCMRSMMLICCLLSGVLGGVFGVRAASLEFRELSWDFGNIEELGGDVSHTFSFRNDSSSPVVISNVRTTCGCTTPEYVKKPIAAGDESTLTVTFDPRFRPGQFKKDIYVYSTLSSEPIVLSIVGRVAPRVLSIEERYPYKLLSGARLGQMYITVSYLSPGDMMQTSVEYYNESDDPIEVEFKARRESERLKLFYDNGVAARSGATLEVGYYIEADEAIGETLRDTVDIVVNGKATGKSIFIKGVWVK